MIDWGYRPEATNEGLPRRCGNRYAGVGVLGVNVIVGWPV